MAKVFLRSADPLIVICYTCELFADSCEQLHHIAMHNDIEVGNKVQRSCTCMLYFNVLAFLLCCRSKPKCKKHFQLEVCILKKVKNFCITN